MNSVGRSKECVYEKAISMHNAITVMISWDQEEIQLKRKEQRWNMKEITEQNDETQR
jgi:uncharacterized membrane protein YjjP (DUF1212 family)